MGTRGNEMIKPKLTVAVVTVTKGRPELEECIASVRAQTYKCEHYLLYDNGTLPKVQPRLNQHICVFPTPIAFPDKDGRRWLAAIPHLINEDVTFFLNDDDWYDHNHVASLMEIINNGNDWAYSLRKIYDKDGNFLFNDECEALGELHEDWNNKGCNFVDWCMWGMRTQCLRGVSAVLGMPGFGSDREFYRVAKQMFPKFQTTKKHSFNFRLGGNAGSVTKEFFEAGHKHMTETYGAKMPWWK
jgi:Glycosyl transferase family 2